MGRRYDRAETTNLLLGAGIDEFAQAGIHGARVDRIAENAGANKSAIYSYFGNKELFFSRAIQATMAELSAAVPMDCTDVPGYAGRLFDYVCEHREVVRLFEHEGMHYAQALDTVPNFAQRVEYHANRAAIVARALPDGADAESVFMGIIAMVYWFVAAPQVVLMIYGPDVDDARKRYRAHIIRFVNTLTQRRHYGDLQI